MLIIRRNTLVKLSIYLMMAGFVCSVSINGRLNLNQIGMYIRLISILLQTYLIVKELNKIKVILLFLLVILSLIYIDKQWIYFLQIFFVCDLLNRYNIDYIRKLLRKISLFNIFLVYTNFYFGFSSYKLLYGFVGNVAYKRETYGLVHPNTLSLLFLSFIVMDYLDKRKIIRTILYLTLIYFLTKTRSIIGLFSILYIFLKLSEFFKKKYIVYIFGKYISLIILVSSVLSKKILYKEEFYLINKLLSNRLELWQYNFSQITVSTFFVGNNYLLKIMDNSYLMLHNYGGLFLIIIYFLIYFTAINKLKKNKLNEEISYLISFSIMFNFESSLLIPGYIFTIYYWFIIYKANCNLKGVKNGKNIGYSPSLQCRKIS
ncbi:MAG: hypothetical protein ACRCZ2_06275 [Fusobacteriaceae bacterium]